MKSIPVIIKIAAVLYSLIGITMCHCAGADPVELADCAIRLDASSESETRIGTAFFCKVGNTSTDRYILTAYHNINGMKNFFLSVNEDSVAGQLAELVIDEVTVVPELDLAIFRCTKEGAAKLEGKWKKVLSNRAALVLATDRFKGKPVVAIGNPRVVYPAGERRPLNSASWASISEYTRWEKVLDKTWYEPGAAQAPVIVMENIHITSGHSGGPIVAMSVEDGRIAYRIAGMVIGGDPLHPSNCWGVPSDEILKYLKNANSGQTVSLRNPNWVAVALREGGYSYSDRLLAYPYSISTNRPTVAIGALQLSENLKKDISSDVFTHILVKYGHDGVCYQSVMPQPRMLEFARQYQAAQKPSESRSDVELDRTKLGADYLLLSSLSVDVDDWILAGSLLDVKTLKAQPIDSIRVKKGTASVQDLGERFWRNFDSPSPSILDGDTKQVTWVTLSLDGRTAASGGLLDRAVRVWDVPLKTVRHSIPMAFMPFGQGTISRDGTLLALRTAGGMLTWGPPVMLSIDTGKEWERFQGLVGPSMKWGIEGNPAGPVVIRNFETGQEHPLIGHDGKLVAAHASPDNRLIAEVKQNDVLIWEAESGTKKFTLSGHQGPVGFFVFSPDGKILATTGSDSTVRLWDLTTGSELATLKGHKSPPANLRFGQDGKRLASWSWGDKAIRIWDVLGLKELSVISLPHARPDPAPDQFFFGSYSVRFKLSPDGSRLAFPWGNEVRVCDTRTGREEGVFRGHKGNVYALAFSPDGRSLASAASDKSVRLYDLVTTKEKALFTNFSSTIYWVGFSRDSQLIAAQGDADLKIIDLPSNRETVAFQWQPSGFDNPPSQATSPDGNLVAVISGKEIRLLSKRDGALINTLKGHEGGVGRIKFSPNGTLLVSESAEDKTVIVWHTTFGRPIATIKRYAFFDVAFSPDGRWLAVAANEGAGVWDMLSGDKHITLAATAKFAFSSDSKFLVVAANKASDKWLQLWDLPLGKERATLRGSDTFPTSLFVSDWGFMSRKGSVVVAAGGRSVVIWPIRTE